MLSDCLYGRVCLKRWRFAKLARQMLNSSLYIYRLSEQAEGTSKLLAWSTSEGGFAGVLQEMVVVEGVTWLARSCAPRLNYCAPFP